MRPRPTLLVLAILATVPAGLWAQDTSVPLDPGRPLTDFTVDVWTEDDGLPQNMASAIAQTPDGFLWLGMEEGLVRFDGFDFRVFRPENAPAFTTPWVTSLWPDPDGTLWIGTAGGGLVRLREGAFTAFTTDDGLPHANVRGLHRDTRGTLWIGTEGGGLAAWDPDGTRRRFTTADGLASDFVLSVGESEDGAVWVGTVDGLTRIRDGSLETFRRSDGLPGSRVNAVLGSADGSVWLGTTDGGLSRHVDGRFVAWATEQGLSSNSVTSLYEDAAGTIWVGTNGGGLNRIVDGEVTSITTARGLPGNLILSLAGDREGGLWLGMTGAGLGRMREGVVRVLGQPEGLSADIALAMHETGDGELWIGTAGGGVNHVGQDGIRAYTTAEGLAHNVVISLGGGGPNGEVWVGTPSGVSRIRDGRVTTLDEDDGLLSAQATAIVVEPGGAVWLGMPGRGLQRWDAGPEAVWNTDNGLPSDFVTSLRLSPSGALWIGTRDGLARLRDDEITTVDLGTPGAPSNAVNGISESASGTLWVASNGGLGRLRPDGTTTRYGPEQGPFEGQIHAAIEDSLGFLWVSSNDGIHRISVGDLDAIDRGAIEGVRSRAFTRADGLRSAEANGGVDPAGLLRADGSVWFPTMRGAARLEPLVSVPERTPPTPVIEYVVVNDVPHPPLDDVVLGPHARTLEFHFTAPTFVAPDEVNFRYRLEGFDDDWVESGARREAYYTALPPGSYAFRTAARRGAGPWNEVEASQPFTLEPYFHETLWFRSLIALGILALAWGAYRLRVRRLEARQRELLALTTEQRRTERALRESRERLQLALDSGRMGTWEWDVSTGRIALDPATEQMLGVNARHIDDALLQIRDRVSPDDHARLAELPKRVGSGESSVHLDFSVHGTDGGPRHVELRGQTFLDEHGRPQHVMGVVADISELMDTQSALRLREEELRHAQKMEAVGRLAGGVAHDFNNLLTTILGRTQFLKESVEEAEAREDLEEIQKSAERAANLTQQLLTFSRKQVLQPRRVDLDELVGDLERMLRRLLREDVILETRLAPNLPAIHADPGSIEQVLVNLVVNAQDAMPQGGRLCIETSFGSADLAAPEIADGPFVVLTVSDTGEGMTEETLKHAFDPFFTTKPIGKGTGLGLATVYGIVQQCGGEVRVDTAVGEGSTFRIYLPASDVPAAGHTGRELAESPEQGLDVDDRHRPDDAGGATERAGRILLVEDDDSVRPLMQKVLTRHGYEVVHAASGHEALEICRREGDTFDLLLSDVVMPGMNGRELAEAVRTIRPDVAVLLVSGHHEDEVLKRGIDEYETAFLRKPFDAPRLIETVDELLAGR